MAFTRFNDDPCRIEKQLQESTDSGRYMLNVPGNGINMPFIEDPYVRMQKWGGNRMTNAVNLESDLFGLTRTINRDCNNINNHDIKAVNSQPINYPTYEKSITEQPRATHPAWMARDLEQTKYAILPLDPQENVCIPFHNNVSTRIMEKENFVAFNNITINNNNNNANNSNNSNNANNSNNNGNNM